MPSTRKTEVARRPSSRCNPAAGARPVTAQQMSMKSP